jgi:hypothetical protein
MVHLLPLFQWAAQAQDPDNSPAALAFANLPAIFPFFRWVDETGLSTYIKSTTWVFPLVETIHILALAVLLGSVFLIDLRLLGLAIRKWSPAQITEQLRPLMNWSVGIILVTGTLLFVAEPRKLFDNAAFGPKMILLALSLIFQYTLYSRVGSIETRIPFWARLAALVSFGLWFGVAVCGRAIGFV